MIIFQNFYHHNIYFLIILETTFFKLYFISLQTAKPLWLLGMREPWFLVVEPELNIKLCVCVCVCAWCPLIDVMLWLVSFKQ